MDDIQSAGAAPSSGSMAIAPPGSSAELSTYDVEGFLDTVKDKVALSLTLRICAITVFGFSWFFFC